MQQSSHRLLVATAIIALAAAPSVGAQDAPRPSQQGKAETKPQVKIHEETPGLATRAKVSGEEATKVALARVPNGHVQNADLEEEDGKLVYTFDIKVPGKSGYEEVEVDAMMGTVLKVEHESAAMHAAERAKDDAMRETEKAAKAVKKEVKPDSAKRPYTPPAKKP